MDRYKIINPMGNFLYGYDFKAENVDTKEVVIIRKLKQKMYNWEEVL
jgi:hypothetical protein